MTMLNSRSIGHADQFDDEHLGAELPQHVDAQQGDHGADEEGGDRDDRNGVEACPFHLLEDRRPANLLRRGDQPSRGEQGRHEQVAQKAHGAEKLVRQPDHAAADAYGHLMEAAGLAAHHGLRAVGGVDELKQPPGFWPGGDPVEVEAVARRAHDGKRAGRVEAAHAREVEGDFRVVFHRLAQRRAGAAQLVGGPVATEDRHGAIRRVINAEFGGALHVNGCPGARAGCPAPCAGHDLLGQIVTLAETRSSRTSIRRRLFHRSQVIKCVIRPSSAKFSSKSARKGPGTPSAREVVGAGVESRVTRQIDLAGASGARYRYSPLDENRFLPPAGANYVIAELSEDGAANVVFAGETDNLASQTWKADLEKARRKFATATVLTRLNVTRAVREAERADLVEHYHPPLNG